MRIHAIQTGRVQIKMSQIDGRGHCLRRQLAPLTDPVAADLCVGVAGRVDGVSADEDAAASTLRTIREFAAGQPTVYLPTHDPAAAERLARRRTAAGTIPRPLAVAS